MRRHFGFLVVAVILCAGHSLWAQSSPSEQVQVGPPPVRRAEAPSVSASAEDLEQKGDQLRGEKAFLDAVDYYRAALKKQPGVARLYNKVGISELLMQRYKEAKKDFEKAIRADRTYADAYNNLGVIYYLQRKQGNAIKQYNKAIALRQDSASYYSNLGAAYFSKKDLPNAVAAYKQAIEIDPDIFERSSHTGVSAQMSSPEDRAHFDYVLAKLYAKMGDADRSLLALRRSMEEGYKGIDAVYQDTEFAGLRKDPRFTQLMASRPLAIPE